MPFSPKHVIRLRVPAGDKIAIGPGKAALLEAIVETGSISAAGRKINMSYRKAWLIVNDMNRYFKSPLVDATKGGQNGGGAHLTEMGHLVLKKYRQLEASAWEAINGPIKEFEPLLAPSHDMVEHGGRDDQCG
jgi:molybdate transport system regulatory protein